MKTKDRVSNFLLFWVLTCLSLALQWELVTSTPLCTSSVETRQSCFDWNDSIYIKMYLRNCYPRPKDWVGIYTPRDGNIGNKPSDWGNSLDWRFVCGSKFCGYAAKYTFLYFEKWWEKLPDGEYKAYLFSNDSFTVKAESEPFTIKNAYNACENTPSPTPPPSESECDDIKGKFVLHKRSKKRNCHWAGKKKTSKRCSARLKHGNYKVKNVCPKTCGDCQSDPTPTNSPTSSPSSSPSNAPTTPLPSSPPSEIPSNLPTASPSITINGSPSSLPSLSPSVADSSSTTDSGTVSGSTTTDTSATP
mmetsp:Transcript_9472/g.19882  ORF Transcript_9472/g.19882 Transcript_9472/m.19882 type:complete len:304 (+) Transcript_9472:136-1047(+)